MKYFDLTKSIFEDGRTDNEGKRLFFNSLFYYCCENDVTPVIKFGAQYPLYIYADILIERDSSDAPYKMNVYLERQGYRLVKEYSIVNQYWNNVLITLWKDLHDKEFCMAYVQYDAVDTYQRLYLDIGDTSPRCICNFRYEFDNPMRGYRFFNNLEKKSLYIMGDCFYSDYECIAQCKHYLTGETVNLFRKKILGFDLDDSKD